jgi:hypothetical protein
MTGEEYHILFDARGEQHARRTAALDGQAGGLGSFGKGAAQVPARAIGPFLYARNLRRDFNAALSRSTELERACGATTNGDDR